jgi:hypothetical protein
MPTTELGAAALSPDMTDLLAAFQEFLQEWTTRRTATRLDGLQNMPADETNDNLVASEYRRVFQEQVLPILRPNASHSAHNQPNQPGYEGTTGYLVGIDRFREVADVFATCDGVQVCFGMDKPIDQGGQIQLVFRGYGGTAPGRLFLTPVPGGPPDTPRVKPCPPNADCAPR